MFFFSYFVITFNYVVEKETFGLTGIVELIIIFLLRNRLCENFFFFVKSEELDYQNLVVRVGPQAQGAICLCYRLEFDKNMCLKCINKDKT